MKFRDLHPNIQIRVGVSFFTQLVSNLVLPLMAVYYAEKAGTAAAGLMSVATVLVGLVSSFFGGYYADRIGRKKLMVLAEALMALAYAVMALANSPLFVSVGLTFIMMMINSICWGLYGPASEAMLLDVSHPDNRKYIYGLIYWINNLSFAVGGLVGALLFRHYLFELLLVMAAVGVISLLITIFYITETIPARSTGTTSESEASTQPQSAMDMLRNYGRVLKDRVFMIYVLASIFVLSVEFHLGNYIGIRLGQEMESGSVSLFGWHLFEFDGIQMLGVLRTENTLMVVLMAAFASRILSRYSDRWVLQAGFLLYVTGFSVLAFANTPWILLTAMLAATLGEVTYVPVKQAFLGILAPKDARSSYMAVNGLVFRGAMTVGAVGIIIGGWIPSWAMALSILASGLTGMTLFFLIMKGLDARKATAE